MGQVEAEEKPEKVRENLLVDRMELFLCAMFCMKTAAYIY